MQNEYNTEKYYCLWVGDPNGQQIDMLFEKTMKLWDDINEEIRFDFIYEPGVPHLEWLFFCDYSDEMTDRIFKMYRELNMRGVVKYFEGYPNCVYNMATVNYQFLA